METLSRLLGRKINTYEGAIVSIIQNADQSTKGIICGGREDQSAWTTQTTSIWLMSFSIPYIVTLCRITHTKQEALHAYLTQMGCYSRKALTSNQATDWENRWGWRFLAINCSCAMKA